jgi:hypothetical protein
MNWDDVTGFLLVGLCAYGFISFIFDIILFIKTGVWLQ